MNTEMNISPKSPFSSRIIDITAILLTAAVFWVTSLRNTPFLEWAFRLLHERGPVQYLIIYFTNRNLLAVIIAKTRKELPEYYFRQLFAFALFPFFLGLLGTVQDLGSTICGFVDMLTAGNVKSLKDAISIFPRGAAISLDTLFLGLLGTVFSLGLYTQTLSFTKKIVQQSVAGYPPQGVWSPEP